MFVHNLIYLKHLTSLKIIQIPVKTIVTNNFTMVNFRILNQFLFKIDIKIILIISVSCQLLNYLFLPVTYHHLKIVFLQLKSKIQNNKMKTF
jgi:hypothetical protein